MTTLAELGAREEEVEREWQWLHDTLNTVAGVVGDRHGTPAVPPTDAQRVDKWEGKGGTADVTPLAANRAVSEYQPDCRRTFATARQCHSRGSMSVRSCGQAFRRGDPRVAQCTRSGPLPR
jgi:hypothetical protein